MDNIYDSKLIFSYERKYRIMRHLLFWCFWGMWLTLTRWLGPNIYKTTGHFGNLFKAMIETFFFVLPHIVIVYPMLYFILPRFIITGKYIKAAFWTLLFLILTACSGALLLVYMPWDKIFFFLDFKVYPEKTAAKVNIAYTSAFLGALSSAAISVGFKMFQHYYLKNHRIQQLLKENIAAQLQILRAQVHPHFLFNTLNNIFSQTQTESPKGSRMIMGLSDTLRYILYEGQKPLVPLRQELQMMKEYIYLEKIRYGNNLDVHIETPDKKEEIYIAPLILLPFVENCFKHGAADTLQNPWINLTAKMENNTLVMKLMNGKSGLRENMEDKPGMGLNNVKLRLDLLYKNKYDLQIREDDEVFVVDLRLELTTATDQMQEDTMIQDLSTIAYT